MATRTARRSTPSGRRRPAPPAPVIEIEVKALTNFAFVAGVTIQEAERILVQSSQWRYPELRCSLECGVQPHVVVDDAWDGRTMLYCTHCGVADLWV